MIPILVYKCSGTGTLCNDLFCLLVFTIAFVTASKGDDSFHTSGNSITSASSRTLHNVNHIMDYLYSLRRSQDEIFRKVEWLTKVVEDRFREEHKFRAKFSRKVHSLENKIFYLEQTLTQKVEDMVEQKINEWSERHQFKIHNHRYNRYHTASDPSKSSGSQDAHNHDHDEDNEGIQNHQPLAYNVRYQPPQHQQHYPPYHHIRHEPHHQNNWGFYEHPITHKKVRDGNIFKYEPPTRDLPLISLVATTSTQLNSPDVKGASPSSRSPPSSSSSGFTTKESQGPSESTTASSNAAMIPSEFIEETLKKFESLELALKVLRGNITYLEREMSRGIIGDSSDMHNVLTDNSREIMNLHKKHQEMIQRIEYFTVEMEKAAAKREHAINVSIEEINADLKKQISSVKAYTKRQIQSFNTTITAIVGSQSQSVADKTRCAQTLLDELITQMNKQKGRYPGLQFPSSLVQPDLIADQAESEMGQSELGKLILPPGEKTSSSGSTEKFLKELELQRKEILELKSEVGRLNISQILLMRTVDEETLKRTVRPRDCSEIRLLRNVSSGIFSVFPLQNDSPVDVYCDMQTDGGGWTVIQRRGSPIIEEAGDNEMSRESFFRSWREYEDGFGNLNGDHWLGLKIIAALCQLGVQQLRIDMTNWSGESRYALYQYFKISNASENYKINVHGYSGSAGDSLSRHAGMSFSTPDNDNDSDPRRHCAKTYFSGWWYYACFESNLNGIYIDESDKNATRAFGTGIIWQHWLGHYSSLKKVDMKVRNTFIGENHFLKRFF